MREGRPPPPSFHPSYGEERRWEGEETESVRARSAAARSRAQRYASNRSGAEVQAVRCCRQRKGAQQR